MMMIMTLSVEVTRLQASTQAVKVNRFIIKGDNLHSFHQMRYKVPKT